MVDPQILKSYGSTTERLKQIFTCKGYEKGDKGLTREEKSRINKDLKIRKKWQERIQNRQTTHMGNSLRNQHIYGAVELAWDSTPINKEIYPLMLYAQGKIDMRACERQLCQVGCKDKFVTKDKDGNVTGINLPKFTEVCVNLVRSVVTRRLAAQCGKYSNLWPFFKYESRSTSQVGKLRADIFSTIVDIMADQYDYRGHQEQVIRDMFLYAHVIDFVRCAWDKEKQMVRKGEVAEMSTGERNFDSRIVKEGLPWVNPHISRTFYDLEYPVRSINSDTGCKYIGYWDAIRVGTVKNDPVFWNRDDLSWSSGQTELFTTYSTYFETHFCSITPPPSVMGGLSSGYANDAKNQLGMYSTVQDDTALIVTNYFEKLTPSEEGFGDYPHPVWVRFCMAGAESIVYAEFLPSTPAAVCSYNESDARAVNISLAHELLSYQDQMTNLLSGLLLAMKNDNIKIIIMDRDLLSAEQMTAIREQCKGKNFFVEPIVMEVSRSEKSEIAARLPTGALGFDPDKAVSIVETNSRVALNIFFQAMLQLMSLMDRLLAMSSQESGQTTQHEISAKESGVIERTTETVYAFISDSIDNYRSAQKRIVYDSYMAFGQKDFKVPAMGRYAERVVLAAGLEVVDEDQMTISQDEPRSVTVLGNKEALVHDYIFTSRDGADRASDTQAAQYLAEVLKSILPIPAVQSAMTKNQLFDLLTEMVRKTGVFDLKLESQDGRGDEPIDGGGGDIQGVIEQLVQTVEKQSGEIAQIQQMLPQIQQLLARIVGPQALPGPEVNGRSAVPE